MKMKMLIIAVSLVSFFLATHVGAQESGLPLGLDYSMSRAQVLAHTKLMALYRVKDTKPNTIAFVVAAPDTNTKNGLFLDFVRDRLVEIASMKSGMNKAMYDTYMERLLSQANKWKAAGVETVWEDKNNSTYLYKDDKSYITISGGALFKDKNKFSVTITFTDHQHHDRKK